MHNIDKRDLRPDHMVRYGWTPNYNITHPEDSGLAIAKTVDKNTEIASKAQELYMRFFESGMIEHHNHECILMSSVLRRILKLHGHHAVMKQVILYYERPAKQQVLTMGAPKNTLAENEIDTHVVVECEGLILDFAGSIIYETFGYTAPRAFIAASGHNDYQDLGELHGQACWTATYPAHPIIRHWRFQQKKKELELTRMYFERFRF